MKSLRICIDARLISGTAGGLEPVIAGLAGGLSSLTDGDEQYLFLTYHGTDSWLISSISKSCQFLYCPIPFQERLRSWINRISPVINRSLWKKFLQLTNRRRSFKLPRSDGTIERSGVDLMHFTRQNAFLTDVPSIFHPHDLLHIHFPHFFNQIEIDEREIRYRTFCEQASMVAVTASWGRTDIIRHYNLLENKVWVVPWAPAQLAYIQPSKAELTAVKRKFSLPDDYILYPAQTWPHKNHLGLLQALAILREKYDLEVPFVSSGRLTEHYSEIRQCVHKMDLSEKVKFLGFVSPIELRCLYTLCRCVVIPTMFEAASGPLWEAFVAGIPAACSNVTSLPQQAKDAALVFDPYNPEEIADAIWLLWTNDTLRNELEALGKRNVSHFNWERTARHFRAHYRRIADRSLTEEDRMILTSPPLL